jgi:hypothetical protein
VIPDHFLSLLLFSGLVAVFFATLNHRERGPFVRSLLKTLGWMVLGSLALAFLMKATSG